jgi:hypothetical protein
MRHAKTKLWRILCSINVFISLKLECLQDNKKKQKKKKKILEVYLFKTLKTGLISLC